VKEMEFCKSRKIDDQIDECCDGTQTNMTNVEFPPKERIENTELQDLLGLQPVNLTIGKIYTVRQKKGTIFFYVHLF